jgi:MoaA/NifB/PqqE/SkfB family radical SAM enzyme
LEQISEINSNIIVFITTNGSVLNERILALGKKFKKISVVVSLDSLDSETYSKIRKNGNLSSVLKNIDTFHEHKMLGSIAFSPMIQNVYETHNIIDFCQERSINFCINTVNSALGGKIKGIHENGELSEIWDGTVMTKSVVELNDKIPEFCLSSLNAQQLDKIIVFLESRKHSEEYQKKLDSFINHLKSIKVQ